MHYGQPGAKNALTYTEKAPGFFPERECRTLL